MSDRQTSRAFLLLLSRKEGNPGVGVPVDPSPGPPFEAASPPSEEPRVKCPGGLLPWPSPPCPLLAKQNVTRASAEMLLKLLVCKASWLPRDPNKTCHGSSVLRCPDSCSGTAAWLWGFPQLPGMMYRHRYFPTGQSSSFSSSLLPWVNRVLLWERPDHLCRFRRTRCSHHTLVPVNGVTVLRNSM